MSTSESLLAQLHNLVRYRTETRDIAANVACLADVEAQLKDRGMHTTAFTFGQYPALLATTIQTKSSQLLLAAHLDVVPADEHLYTMDERDGKLYGRGVFDMKFAAACYLQLIDDLTSELNQYDFGILFTTDEELGGNSVDQLLAQGYGASVCVLPDGGNDWKLEVSNNGAWFIRLQSSGQTAHGSRPWEGQNAIDRLLLGIQEIKSVFGDLTPEKCSCTVSSITGGDVINQVPSSAEATIDMRFRDTESYQAKRSTIEALALEFGLGIETIAQVDPGVADVNEPYIAAFLETAQQVSGKPVGQCHSLGSSDAHYFVAKGIPTILMRPSGGHPHGDKEWIDKAEFMQFYDVIKAYTQRVARRG